MKKRTTIYAALLMTSVLISPAALAQNAPAEEQINDTAANAPDADGADNEAQNDQAQDDNIDISAPGVNNDNVIIVRGKFIPNPVRATPEVVSVLGAEEIARTAEGDIAGSLQRVTGLSVVGGRFVFVRGLGERYSLALLNGLPLPSPEPLRRVVPLDLFPTSVIASTLVQKSYSANYPGEFGGGVINLTTKTTPDEPFLDVSFGISGDTETTGQLGFTHEGGNTDILGFDDGETRAVPPALQAAFDQNVPIQPGPNFTSQELQNFAASLNNAETNLIQRNRDIPANFSASISAGTTIEAGDALIGIVATGGYDNKWRTRGGLQQSARGVAVINGEDALVADDNLAFVTTENRVIINGLLGISAEFGENKIRWTNVYIHDGLKESSISTGFLDSFDDTLVSRGRTNFFDRQLYTTQLVGEFEFGDFSLDVRGSYANASREAPYERSSSFAFDDQIANDFVNNLRSDGQSANIRFSDLNDDVYGGGIDLAYITDIGIPVTLTGGYSYYRNDREAEQRNFQLVPENLAITPPFDQQRVDFLLSDANIFNFGIILEETVSAASVPAYEAGLEVHAAYGQVKAELAPGLDINLGLRYEDAAQSVTPLFLTGTSAGSAGTPTNLNNSYFLPAGTVTWNFADDMQLRFAASRTIARPQFRELAFQQFLDTETGRTFIGNPLLEDSELLNFEGRFEYYIGRGERITIAGFYKDIDNPIENVAFISGGNTLFNGFSNAPSATLLGGEIELVKYLPLYDWGGFFQNRRILVAANYTYTESEISASATDTVIDPLNLNPVAATGVFDDGARLTGQSEHVANLQFGLETDDGLLSQQTILLTYNSPRVTARGPGDQPDLIERPGVQLDIVLREEMEIAGQLFELKVQARNILGTDYTESQRLNGTEVFNNAFDVGTSFSAGLTVKF